MYRTKALADGSTLVDFGEGFRRIEFDPSSYDARLSLPRVARFKAMFDEASRETGVPAAWLAAIAYHETRGDETKQIPGAGQGLMGITRTTAGSLGVDPMNPREAIHGAARYLRPLWLAGRSMTEAASGYERGYSLRTATPHTSDRRGPCNPSTWGLCGTPSYLEGVTRLANTLLANPSLLPDVEPPSPQDSPDADRAGAGAGVVLLLAAGAAALLLRARSR